MIKKLFLVFIFLLFSANVQAFAFGTDLCPCKPYPVSTGAGRFFSNATGTNFLLTSIAEHQLQKILKKQIGGKNKVQIKAYGGKNFLDGKFQSLTLKSKNVNMDGVYISELQAETLCDFNHITPDKKELYINENMLLSFKALITENDLKNTIMSEIFQKRISNINLKFSGIMLFKIIDTDIAIKNNKMRYSFKVISPFIFTGQPYEVAFETSPKIENGKIQFSDIFLKSKNRRLNLRSLLPVINALNPFIQEVKLSKTARAIIKIKNVYIENNILQADGVVFIPKNHIAK